MGVSSINHVAFVCTSVFRTTKCKIPCARTFLLQRLLDACWSQTKTSRTSQANVSYWDCLKVSVSTDLWFVDIQNQICWRNDKCFLWDITAQPFDHSQSISLKLLERGGGAFWKLWRLVLSAKHQLACVVGSSIFPNLGISVYPHTLSACRGLYTLSCPTLGGYFHCVQWIWSCVFLHVAFRIQQYEQPGPPLIGYVLLFQAHAMQEAEPARSRSPLGRVHNSGKQHVNAVFNQNFQNESSPCSGLWCPHSWHLSAAGPPTKSLSIRFQFAPT